MSEETFSSRWWRTSPSCTTRRSRRPWEEFPFGLTLYSSGENQGFTSRAELNCFYYFIAWFLMLCRLVGWKRNKIKAHSSAHLYSDPFQQTNEIISIATSKYFCIKAILWRIFFFAILAWKVWCLKILFRMPHPCHGNANKCPTRSHPIWELPINELDRRDDPTYDEKLSGCHLVSSCSNIYEKEQFARLLRHNFNRHYQTNRKSEPHFDWHNRLLM